MAFTWFKKHKDSINTWSDTFSHLAVIFSLVIGAIWTYSLFVKKDAPALEYRGKLNTDIEWTVSREEKYCWGTLKTSLKNEGLSSFDVTGVLIRGWYYSIKTSADEASSLRAPTTREPTIVDDQKIMSSQPDLSKEYTEQNIGLPDGDSLPGLITHYPPAGEANQEIAFIFQRDPTSGVIFKVDVTTKAKKTQQFVSSAFVGDQICGQLKEDEKNKAVKEK